jgi:hypothetical protein
MGKLKAGNSVLPTFCANRLKKPFSHDADAKATLPKFHLCRDVIVVVGGGVGREVATAYRREKRQSTQQQKYTHFSVIDSCKQGCQIFLGTTYQNGNKLPKSPQNIPNGHKIYEMAVKYTEWP